MYYNDYESVDELANVRADLSVMPSHTLTFTEDAVYVAQAIEESYNDLFMSIGINELAVYESTGDIIVYEGGKLSEFKDSVIRWLKGIWEKIKGFFNKVLDKFEEMRKKSVKKFGKITAADVDKIDNDKSLGKVHTFNELMKGKYLENAKSFLSDIKIAFEDLAKSKADEDALKQKQEYFLGVTCEVVSGISGVKDIKKMKERYKEKYVGEEKTVTKQFVKDNLKELIAVVMEGSTKRKIKDDYNRTKKIINDEISRVKKMEDGDIKNSFKYSVNVMKEIVVCMHAVCAVTLDICVRRYTEYRNILAKVYSYANVGDKKETSTGESYYGGYTRSYQTDLVSEAFDW